MHAGCFDMNCLRRVCGDACHVNWHRSSSAVQKAHMHHVLEGFFCFFFSFVTVQDINNQPTVS